MSPLRIQKLDGDTVLEVTQVETTKLRFSQKDLLREKAYFEEMVQKGQDGLVVVDERLGQIEYEASKGG